MIVNRKAHRIVFLVRMLTVIGLVMVISTTGLVGWMLTGLRRERAQATAEQDEIDQLTRQLHEKANACRAEIGAILDETIPMKTGTPAASGEFSELLDRALRASGSSGAKHALKQLDECAIELVELEKQARDWHATYEPVYEDLAGQHTISRVRQLINQLEEAVDNVEGRRRLDGAIDYRRWRESSGPEAAQLAETVVINHARQESEGTSNFSNQLAELARLTERLGSEEQFDALEDLKKNKIKPVLDWLGHSIVVINAHGIRSQSLKDRAIEQLRVALFGDGYTVDEAHQDIHVGRGGLFTLRRDVLHLRREREKLKSRLGILVQDIATANATYARAAESRNAALTQQMEHSVTVGWTEMLLFGAGCVVAFFWVAWLIARGINDQVLAIEKASGDLEVSERRFRTLSGSAPIGVFETDGQGQTLYVNQRWQDLSGLSLAESVRDGWQQALHPEDAFWVFEQWHRDTQAGLEFDCECRLLRPGGELRWARTRATALRDEKGEINGFVGMVEDISPRKKAEAEMEAINRKLFETSRQAGMAEVATAVLHNVGNVLNSVNVASGCMTANLRKSKVGSLGRVVALLQEHEADLGAFMTANPQGKQIPGFLAHLNEKLRGEQATVLEDLEQLQKNVDHIKDIVSRQQSYSRVSGLSETVQVVDLVEDTLRMHAGSSASSTVRIDRHFAPVPQVTVEKHKVLQILVNLVRNAQQACETAPHSDKAVTLRIFNGDGTVKIAVSDNGCGISPENVGRIFHHGFTTKKDGHGFGLHSSALAAREMGGALQVESDGLGHGATFTLELPVTHPN